MWLKGQMYAKPWEMTVKEKLIKKDHEYYKNKADIFEAIRN